MENQQKWVNLSFVVVAALVAFVVFSLGQKAGVTWDFEARIKGFDLILRGLSVVLAALVFVVLYRNDSANQFMNEVVVELERVTWPTQRETVVTTGVVIVMVLVAGAFLGFLDYLWTALVKWVL